MIPQMIKNGYPRLFAVNVTISGSLQPLLIPPSHNAVIYSLAAGGTVSVAHLFMAGVIPGLLLGLSLMILCLIIAYRNNFPKGEVIPLRQALCIARRGDLGPGHGRSSSSAASSPASSRRPSRRRSPASTPSSSRCSSIATTSGASCRMLIGRVVRTVGMVMIMIGFSIAFGYMMAIMRVPAMATEFFVAHLQRQVHVPALRQHPAAVPRHLHGPGADAADLHADLPAGDQDVRHRPRALRHHHDPQPRHRPADAAGRPDDGGRLRHRQGVAWRRCRAAS